MAATPSNMLPLGTKAANFTLFDTVSGENKSSDQLKGKNGTLIMFVCNHCPFVIHVNKQLVQLVNDYFQKGINGVAISSNDIINYPQDAPELMNKVAKENAYPFPYLYDETQEVAKAYMAACTPDFFLFDGDDKLVYRGQLDSSRPGNDIPVTGKDIRKAIDLLLEGKTIPEKEQLPSIGCNIKWK